MWGGGGGGGAGRVWARARARVCMQACVEARGPAPYHDTLAARRPSRHPSHKAPITTP